MAATLTEFEFDHWVVGRDHDGRRFVTGSDNNGSFTATRADGNDALEATLDAALIAGGDADDSADPDAALMDRTVVQFEVTPAADGQARLAAFRPKVRPMVALLDGRDRDQVLTALHAATAPGTFDMSADHPDGWGTCNGCGEPLVDVDAEWCRRGYCRDMI